MNTDFSQHEPERYELTEAPRYRFSLSRRAFVQCVGAGILITTTGGVGLAQRPSSGSRTLGGRFQIDSSGIITAFTSKVEVGQGSRTQLTMAAAEEFRVPISQVHLVMADTALVPNDGGTFGSLTTPRTVPAMRHAAEAARGVLLELAAEHWGVDPAAVSIQNGVLEAGKNQMTLAELAEVFADINEHLDGVAPSTKSLAGPGDWRVLGTSPVKVDARAVVTGQHEYPSDIKRPGMLYGKVLRPPSYGATLAGIDLDAAKSLEGVHVVHDGDFIGCAAPTSRQAQKAIDALAATAQWDTQPHPSSKDLYAYLKANVREGSGRYRSREQVDGDVNAAIQAAARVVRAEYHVPYIQHAPMEPRAAVAEWTDGNLTVWTGTQRPFGVHGELTGAFRLTDGRVRVVVPDTGGGFGGKHTGDAAIEAARLAQAIDKPVSLQWTREEEFTWAYFRPAAVLDIAAAIDANGAVTAWDYTNYNSGTSGLACPYTFVNRRVAFKYSESPLREGSYRALASAANNFAREAFIDRLAAETNADPVDFRVRYLDDGRLKDVLLAAAKAFDWNAKRNAPGQGAGYGIACGTEKGSFVATCAEVEVNESAKRIHVRRLLTAYECGAIQHPHNLQAQVDGCVVMGLGAAMTETIEFENGRITNPNFKDYVVPRFKDVPPMETVLVDRPDLSSAGAGETPIIGVAPAIANAIFQATGKHVEALPVTTVFG